MPAVRWQENHPGCSFWRSEDGKYHYGLDSGDITLTIAIDAQEPEKVNRRHEPFFSIFVTVRDRGTSSLEVDPGAATLEFLNHFQVRQPSLDPDDFAQEIQTDADTVDNQTAREIEKHPEQKELKDSYVRAFQKDAAELIDFVTKNSLRTSQISAANPEVSGWVLFSTNSKWIGKWKKQETMIFRLPMQRVVFEIPFKLPPNPGDLLLRKR